MTTKGFEKMTARKRLLAASFGLAGVVLPLAAAGTAQADEDPTAGYPSTQSPLQGVDSLLETSDTTNYGFLDALDTFDPNNRPDGVNGTDTEFPQADPRFVEGPAGGLLKDGPFH